MKNKKKTEKERKSIAKILFVQHCSVFAQQCFYVDGRLNIFLYLKKNQLEKINKQLKREKENAKESQWQSSIQWKSCVQSCTEIQAIACVGFICLKFRVRLRLNLRDIVITIICLVILRTIFYTVHTTHSHI